MNIKWPQNGKQINQICKFSFLPNTHTQAAAIIIRIKNMRKKQRFATSWEPVHLPGAQILTPS